MTMTSTEREVHVPDSMDPVEWQIRCDLAAALQLTDLFGYSDLAGNHISARLPGPEHTFLLNPLGTLYDQITASSLIKVDLEGNVLDGDPSLLNPAGFVIHGAVHLAKPELQCVMHTHTRANNGVGSVKEGLLPLTQKAMSLLHFLSYHDFEGAALDLEERERIVRDLGDGRVVILRNHGALTVGASIAEAWVWHYRLETACRFQIDAMSCVSGGLTIDMPSEATIKRTMDQGRAIMSRGGAMPVGTLEWPSLLRKLERERGLSYLT